VSRFSCATVNPLSWAIRRTACSLSRSISNMTCRECLNTWSRNDWKIVPSTCGPMWCSTFSTTNFLFVITKHPSLLPAYNNAPYRSQRQPCSSPRQPERTHTNSNKSLGRRVSDVEQCAILPAKPPGASIYTIYRL